MVGYDGDSGAIGGGGHVIRAAGVLLTAAVVLGWVGLAIWLIPAGRG